ncbi:unnamed protein product [Brassica oleracea]|uniref:(rape) hypothetical protein n=1 Tax=Brassica napus TaxID=3708 RepID=A0A816MKR3_BRANA|nr:unnamed protein product [Brassica napus]
MDHYLTLFPRQSEDSLKLRSEGKRTERGKYLAYISDMKAREQEPETCLERVTKRVTRLFHRHDLFLVLEPLPLFLGRQVVFTIVAFERVASEIFLSVESVDLGAYESNAISW